MPRIWWELARDHDWWLVVETAADERGRFASEEVFRCFTRRMAEQSRDLLIKHQTPMIFPEDWRVVDPHSPERDNPDYLRAETYG